MSHGFCLTETVCICCTNLLLSCGFCLIETVSAALICCCHMDSVSLKLSVFAALICCCHMDSVSPKLYLLHYVRRTVCLLSAKSRPYYNSGQILTLSIYLKFLRQEAGQTNSALLPGTLMLKQLFTYHCQFYMHFKHFKFHYSLTTTRHKPSLN